MALDYMALQERRAEHRQRFSINIIAEGRIGLQGIEADRLIKFVCHLENWGRYTNNEPEKYLYGFILNNRNFFDRLVAFLEDDRNKQLVMEGIANVIHRVRNTDSYEKRFYYAEFLEDLEVLAKIKVKWHDFNYIPKAIYSRPDAPVIEYVPDVVKEDYEHMAMGFGDY